jgi:hypothetical protein
MPNLIDLYPDGFETHYDTTVADSALGHNGYIAYGILNDAGDNLALLVCLLP